MNTIIVISYAAMIMIYYSQLIISLEGFIRILKYFPAIILLVEVL